MRRRTFSIAWISLCLSSFVAAGCGPAGDVDPTESSVEAAADELEGVTLADQLDKFILHAPCCMLSPSKGPGDPMNNLLGPGDLGAHKPLDVEALQTIGRDWRKLVRAMFTDEVYQLPIAPEGVGIMYTTRAGFMDIAHIRMIIDITHRFHDQLVRKGGKKGSVLVSLRSTVTLDEDVPESEFIDVARSIAYDEFLAHEVAAYGKGKIGVPAALRRFYAARGFHLPEYFCPGGHHSAFAPEDLASNFVGTKIAGEALERLDDYDGDFNRAVEDILERRMQELGATDKETAMRAFEVINHVWVDHENALSHFGYDYVLRRNFTRTPWLVEGMSEPTPDWMNEPLGAERRYYTQVMKEIGEVVAIDEIDTRIAETKALAFADYGPLADSPEIARKASPRGGAPRH